MGAAHAWLEKNRKRYKSRDSLIAAGAKRFHRGRQVFADFVDGKIKTIYGDDPSVRRRGGPGSGPRPSATSAHRKRGGVTIDQLMAVHDTDTKIRNAIRKAILTLPPTEAVTDAEFRTNYCGLGSTGWKLVSAEPEFKSHRFRITGVGGALYWATVETVKAALERLPFNAKEV